jgi:hypothetical protein
MDATETVTAQQQIAEMISALRSDEKKSRTLLRTVETLRAAQDQLSVLNGLEQRVAAAELLAVQAEQDAAERTAAAEAGAKAAEVAAQGRISQARARLADAEAGIVQREARVASLEAAIVKHEARISEARRELGIVEVTR